MDWQWTKPRPYDWERDDHPTNYSIGTSNSTSDISNHVPPRARQQRVGSLPYHVGGNRHRFSEIVAQVLYPLGRGFKH